jgi:drug/metabolite transporter (DMT)-like permease
MSPRAPPTDFSHRVAHAPRQALLVALAGFVILAIGDVVVKSMADEWPGAAIACLRYAFGAAGLAALVWLRFGRSAFVLPKPWVQFGRGLAVGTATATFFLALNVMPLADATAIVFTSPIWTAVLSFLFLRERAPRAVLVSILLATAGVLLILRPNVLTFGWPALLPLAAAVAMAALFILNRKVGGLAPVIVMQFVVAAMALPILIVLMLAGHVAGGEGQQLSWPDWTVVARCLLVAVTATTGHWCIFRATELASAATIAPMTYVQLLVAAAAGWLLFGDYPTLSMIGGAALIISGGLWLWYSQKSRPAGEAPA